MADTPSASRRRIPHSLLAAFVTFAIACLHGLAPAFLYDAAQYWGGALALVTGGDPVAAGGLSTRGVYTAAAYLPPALVTGILGDDAAGWSVLVWNAALTAILSAVLLPRLAQLATGSTSAPPASRIWVSALIGGVLLSGFARFPLVDVTSTGLALAGLYGLLASRRWPLLALAGVALCVGANMRPSLLAPIGIALIVVLFRRPRGVLISAGTGIVTLLPQVALNATVFGQWSAVPRETGALSTVQAAYAHVALRYDTVAFADQRPQQWYCDPAYASLVAGDDAPTNQLQVIGSAFAHLPDSLWFLVRKAAASLQWTVETPYEPPPGSGADAITVLATAVAALGVAVLVWWAIRTRADRDRRFVVLALLGFWFGAVGVLVFATPETRFAVPIVVIGVVGAVSAVPARLSDVRLTRGTAVVAVCAALLTVGLLAAGGEALSHPFPAGPLPGAEACADRR